MEIGDILDGVVSHQVEVPWCFPLLAIQIQGHHVFPFCSLLSIVPRAIMIGERVLLIVDLDAKVSENRSSDQKGSSTIDDEDLNASRFPIHNHWQVNGPCSMSGVVASKLKELVCRSELNGADVN